MTDEPLQRGGTDKGLTPVEYVFIGEVGSTQVISNKLAAANGIAFRSMEFDIDVTMDSHGTRLMCPFPRSP